MATTLRQNKKPRASHVQKPPAKKKRYIDFWFLVRLVFGQARHQFLADVEDTAFHSANRDA